MFATGLFGALSQQTVVMIMMGLELMINALLVAGAAFWYFLTPARPDGQVLVLVVLAAMTGGDGDGFRGHHAAVPGQGRGHDRHGRGAARMTAALWLLFAVPVTVGGLLALAGRRLGRAAAAVGLVTAVVVLALAVTVAVGRPAVSVVFVAGGPFGVAVDGLGASVVVAVAAVALLVLTFAVGDVTDARARFFGLMLLCHRGGAADRDRGDAAGAAARLGGDGRYLVCADRVPVA